MIANITTGPQTVTATGAVTPTTGLDISGVTKDCTVHISIQNLSAAAGIPVAGITFEDSVNAFAASVPVLELPGIQGVIDPRNEVHIIRRKYELANCRWGVAGAVLRVNVVSLTGTTPTITLAAWLET